MPARPCHGRMACDEACSPHCACCTGPFSPSSLWPRTGLGAGRPPARSRPDARGAHRHRSGAQGQEPHRRRSPDACKAQNDALGLALQGAVADLTPRLAGVGEAPGGAHAQTGRDRAHDRRRGQGAREREKAARHARRQPARRPRHAAGGRRPLHPHQRGAAPIVRAPDIRPVVERPRSGALGRRLAGSSDRRRGDAEPDRQLARRRRRTADARGENRHCGGRARARASRRAACLAHPPGRPSRSRRERAEPAPPRARRRVDLLHPGGAAARRPRPAGERARRLRPFRSERPGPHRRGA